MQRGLLAENGMMATTALPPLRMPHPPRPLRLLLGWFVTSAPRIATTATMATARMTLIAKEEGDPQRGVTVDLLLWSLLSLPLSPLLDHPGPW